MEELPELASKLVDRTEEEGTPLYFKIIDFSREQSPEYAARGDRMVIYTNEEHMSDLLDYLEDISWEQHDWIGAKRPLLTAPVSETVGIGAHPTDAQREIVDGGASFSTVRAEFLGDVWEDALEELVRNPETYGDTTAHKAFKNNGGDIEQDLNYSSQNGAWQETFMESIPQIPADTLLEVIGPAIENQAENYHIDPENLALNT
jgi:hypothetical protein